jgi:hypothetical protein
VGADSGTYLALSGDHSVSAQAEGLTHLMLCDEALTMSPVWVILRNGFHPNAQGCESKKRPARGAGVGNLKQTAR